MKGIFSCSGSLSSSKCQWGTRSASLLRLQLLLLLTSAIDVSAQNDSVKIDIRNLGADVNSPYAEYSPVISADGAIMLYTSRKPNNEKDIKKNKQSMEMIYMSTWNNSGSKWNASSPAPSPVNINGRNNVVLGLSNDGQRMMIYRDDDAGNGNIWETDLEGTVWSEPELLPAPINTEHHESSASLAPDGKTLYFVSNRPGGLGGRDIWISTKDANGVWSTPMNPGAAINTKEDEEGVFIHPDGVTLYFSSKGHKGSGGYDIYKSTRVNGMWATAENLGQPVNTAGDELFYQLTADGKKAYYASSGQPGSIGDKDIYEITYTPIEKKKDTGPKLTLLKGIVTDSLTHKPLAARIDIYDNTTNELITTVQSNSASGAYLVSLPAGRDYNITATAPGYLFHSDNFNIPDSANFQQVERNIELQKLEVGSSIVLNNIFFDYNKATLRSESYVELNNLLKLMQENPTLVIEISGHTDNRGTAEYNKKLSNDRAHAVVDYLISKGIPASRMTYAGYGFDKPIAPNDNEANMQLNRRVEFKIISK